MFGKPMTSQETSLAHLTARRGSNAPRATRTPATPAPAGGRIAA